MKEVRTTLDEETYNYIKEQNLAFNTLIKLGLAQFQTRNQLTKDIEEYITQAIALKEAKLEEKIKEFSKKHTKLTKEEVIDLVDTKINELKQSFQDNLNQILQSLDLNDKKVNSTENKVKKLDKQLKEMEEEISKLTWYISSLNDSIKEIKQVVKIPTPKKPLIERILKI